MKGIKFSDFVNGLNSNSNPDFLSGVKSGLSVKYIPSPGAILKLFHGTINMNTTSDQMFSLSGGIKFIITDVVITNASVNMDTANDFEIWTGTNRTGNQLSSYSPNIQSLTTPSKYDNSFQSTNGGDVIGNVVYGSLGTPQGSDATADIYIFGYSI